MLPLPLNASGGAKIEEAAIPIECVSAAWFKRPEHLPGGGGEFTQD